MRPGSYILAAAVGVLLLAGETLCAQAPTGPAAPFGAPAAGIEPPAASGPTAPALELPVATRQNNFDIPFSLNLPTDPAQQPLEVQLYVSADRGAKWQIYSRQLPSATKFSFRAARDGEYWFAVRTVDRAGKLRPEGKPQAELKVVVDTSAPLLEVAADVGPSGEVRVRWNATDPQLDATTFRLESQGSEKNWEQVAVDPPADAAARTAWESSANWWPKSSSRIVNLRAQVWDRAGNSTLVNKQVFLPRGAASTPPDVAAGTAPAKPIGASPPAATVGDPFLAHRQISPPAGTAAANPVGVAVPPNIGASSTAAPPSKPNPLQNVSVPLDVPTGAGLMPPPTTPPTPALPHEPAATTTASDPPSAATTDLLKLPPGERPRMTNRTRFNLDYEVDSVGPSGVAKVELFGSRDGGRSWQLLGADPDKQSPFEVEVASEGVYGFKIVIEAGSGLASKRPQSGDPADIWVGVDTTQPVCRVTTAQYGTGDQAGHLDIRWEASDANPAERPITLHFSDATAGPWTTIAAGLPNSGQYLWKVDPRVPTKIFLKMDARDASGNVGSHVLETAISVEGLAPKARIRGFLPTGDGQ